MAIIDEKMKVHQSEYNQIKSEYERKIQDLTGINDPSKYIIDYSVQWENDIDPYTDI